MLNTRSAIQRSTGNIEEESARDSASLIVHLLKYIRSLPEIKLNEEYPTLQRSMYEQDYRAPIGGLEDIEGLVDPDDLKSS